MGEEIEKEKDRLLEEFMSFARKICETLRDRGFWADYIDPCSGLAMLTEGANKVVAANLFFSFLHKLLSLMLSKYSSMPFSQ